MNDLLGMKQYAVRRGLCGEYRGIWDSASSARDLVDMALRVDGIQFMAEGIANGWGMSPAYIRSNFGDYINGAYICRHGRRYTSEIWCDYRGGDWVGFQAVLVLVAYCDMRIRVPANRVVDLHVTGGSCLDIECHGVAYIAMYGENDVRVKTIGKGRVVRRTVELPTDGSIRFVGERRRGG